MSQRATAFALCFLLLAGATGAAAQDKGSLDPPALAPLAHPEDPRTPAKELFGRKATPIAGAAQPVGFLPTAVSPAPPPSRSPGRPGR